MLASARRRWVAARVVEWAAVGAVAASAGALPVLAGWSVAYRFETLAVVLCTLPLVAAVIVALSRDAGVLATTKRSEDGSPARPAGILPASGFGGDLPSSNSQAYGAHNAGETPASRYGSPAWPSALRGLVGGVLLSVFVGGLAGVVIGEYLHVPRAAWLIHVALSAGAGAALAWLCRPDAMETAAWLDRRLGLRERLATSAELLSRGRADAMAEAVYAQAADVADAADVRRASVWTLGRGTVGALCLALLACTVVLLSPAYGPAGAAGALEGLSGRVAEMTPAQLHRLAEALRQSAATDAEGTRWILEAAAAADAGDKELLAESLAVLARLIEEGKIRLVKLPSALAEGTLGDDFGVDGAGGRHADAGHANAAGNGTSANNAADTVTADQTQRVFHPEYSRLTEPNSANAASNAAANATAPSATYISFDHAWDQARARASQSLADGEIPSNRRQAVREFFRTP
ncbi:MAG: hypothetical protein FWE88_05675 [Phycisphaerae bacterium]|nr:hypothetical protein [Phycisphaerae bacterium]